VTKKEEIEEELKTAAKRERKHCKTTDAELDQRRKWKRIIQL
jgi:hypothetical protein